MANHNSSVDSTGRRDLASRCWVGVLAAVVLAFQLLVINHVYSHPVDLDETACQVCLVGSHATPPADVASMPVLPVIDVHPVRIDVSSVLDTALPSPAQARAPPFNVSHT